MTGRRGRTHRIRFVIENSFLIFGEDPPPGHSGAMAQRLVFLGEDPQQVPLEVMAVKIGNDNLKVVHAMKLRSRYRDVYEEVRR